MWLVREGVPWVGRRANDLLPWAAKMAVTQVRPIGRPAGPVPLPPSSIVLPPTSIALPPSANAEVQRLEA